MVVQWSVKREESAKDLGSTESAKCKAKNVKLKCKRKSIFFSALGCGFKLFALSFTLF